MQADYKAPNDPVLSIYRLCELNVLRQTFNVCTSPVVQEAWASNIQLSVMGLIYSLKDGLLRNIVSQAQKSVIHA